MPKIRNINTLQLDGGALCFDFINTVYAWRGPNLHEYLNSYKEVIKWCKKVNIMDALKRAALLKEASLHPVKATEAYHKMKETREMLYRFFSVMAAHSSKDISPKLLIEFNTVLSASFSHVGFIVKKKQLQQGWNNHTNDLLEPLWLIMKSAFDMLVTEDRSRIKECPKCGWMFIDNTKNNKRRWCNPAFCGSTEKSRKYYQKKRKAELEDAVKQEDQGKE